MKTLISLALAGSLATSSAVFAGFSFVRDLEPAINGEVSASGLFPTQAMEDQFNAYVRWTRENGLPLDYALAVTGADAATAE